MASKQLDLLKNSYDDYVNQLQKNKISAQNAIATSTEKAKSLLDNKLKAQGLNNSGVGLSQYTALANQKNSNIAQSNRAYNQNYADATKEYNQNLVNYYDEYNAQVKSEGQNLLQNMSSKQATEYINNLKNTEGVTEDTLSYLDSYKNSIANSKNDSYNEQIKNEAVYLLQNMSNDQAKEYIDNLRNTEGITENTLNYLENYKNSIANSKNESYNAQVKSDAVDLLQSMSSSEGATYIQKLQESGNVSDETINYLTQYLNGVNNAKSTQALNEAKSELSQLGDYASMQKYIESAKANGSLSDEQIKALQSYASSLGYDWSSTKGSYVNQIAEMLEAVDTNSKDYGILKNAYQQLKQATTQEQFNSVINSLDIDNMLSSVGTGSNDTKSYLDEHDNIPQMKAGESISTSTLEYYKNKGMATTDKDGNYSIVINNKEYKFDNSGKLLADNTDTTNTTNTTNDTSNISLKQGQKLSATQINELSQYLTDTEETSNGRITARIYTINGNKYYVNPNNQIYKVEQKQTNYSASEENRKNYARRKIDELIERFN